MAPRSFKSRKDNNNQPDLVVTEDERSSYDGAKEFIKKAYEHDLSLDVTTFAKLMRENDKLENEEFIDLLLKTDPTYDDTKVIVPLSATDLDPAALALAEKLESNPAFVAAAHEWVETEQSRRRLPAVTALEMFTTLSKDDIMGSPVPGSRHDDDDLGNKTPDVRKAGEGSYYGDVAAATKEGAEIRHTLKLISMAQSEGEETPAQYKGKSDSWLEAEESTQRGRFNSLKNVIKTAMTTCKRIYILPEETALRADFWTVTEDGKKVIPRTNVPIEVYYMAKEKDSGTMYKVNRYVSVNTFCRVELDKIAVKSDPADQLEAFKAKRGKKKGDKDADYSVINNGPKTQAAFYEITGRFDDVTWRASVDKQIASDEGGEFLWAIKRMEEFCHAKLVNKTNKEKLEQYLLAKEQELQKAS